jgi:riboflavin kinase
MKAQVVKGNGEGAKYVEVYADKIYKEVGIKPFHGTLNLRVESIPPVEMIEIDGFGQFGDIELAPCAVNYERAFAVFPEKGGHRDENIVEIISEKNLKETLNLKDGDFVYLQL